MTRQPLKFTLAEPAAAPAAKPDAEPRQQVGARVPVAIYRQLKARAALDGRKVQDLVELAIERFLAE